MTLWLLQPSLTPEEEVQIESRAYLALPFSGLPDLSMITSRVEFRHLLQALHPDDPPEAITRKTDKIWPLYAGLQAEDIIAVPLKSRKELAIAEVTQKYGYGVGDSGEDVHRVAVKWYVKRVKQKFFGGHDDWVSGGGENMREITDPRLRAAIRERLPHSYNRFVKWKWLLVLFFILGLLRQFERLMAGH